MMLLLKVLRLEHLATKMVKYGRVKDNTGGLMDMYRSNWVSYDILDAKNLLKRMDSIFLSIYLIEFLLKVPHEPPHHES